MMQLQFENFCMKMNRLHALSLNMLQYTDLLFKNIYIILPLTAGEVSGLTDAFAKVQPAFSKVTTNMKPFCNKVMTAL